MLCRSIQAVYEGILNVELNGFSLHVPNNSGAVVWHGAFTWQTTAPLLAIIIYFAVPIYNVHVISRVWADSQN